MFMKNIENRKKNKYYNQIISFGLMIYKQIYSFIIKNYIMYIGI